jgi:branched-chain amino acid aminotransferase
MAFSLSMYPWVYEARFTDDSSWSGRFIEQEHKTPAEEASLSPAELSALQSRRNSMPSMPFVSYTNQYGLGCFEGLKALPQKDGGFAIFRPDENARRFRSSMEGLRMPGFPEDSFLDACLGVVARNAKLGFGVEYDRAWEKDDYLGASSVYIRPFSYAEGGIGVALSKHPLVYVLATPVSAYFSCDECRAVTSERIRATPKGTGWIKCDSNYVISALAKSEANAAGFMEVIFLDATHRKYVEEGSSCNIFFYLKDGTLVTPALGDTILPGITRKSVIQLAKDRGIKVEERPIDIEEAMGQAKECFVSGTAAGISPIESITHKGKTAQFTPSGKPMGEFARDLLSTLKGIQYGKLPDTYGWMKRVPTL